MHCRKTDGRRRVIYYFILLLLRDAGHGSGPHRHRHGHGHGHAGGRTRTSGQLAIADAIREAEGGGDFAINPQTLIFFVFPTANCCGCCSGTFPRPSSSLSASDTLAAGVNPLPLRARATRRGLSQTQPSMRIEWNHKLIKRDLFAASKGFCQPTKTTRRREHKENVRWSRLPLTLCVYVWVL